MSAVGSFLDAFCWQAQAALPHLLR